MSYIMCKYTAKFQNTRRTKGKNVPYYAYMHKKLGFVSCYYRKKYYLCSVIVDYTIFLP